MRTCARTPQLLLFIDSSVIFIHESLDAELNLLLVMATSAYPYQSTTPYILLPIYIMKISFGVAVKVTEGSAEMQSYKLSLP